MAGHRKDVFFENLDGLRFLCFLSVFLFHSFHTDLSHVEENGVYQFFTTRLFVNGNLGVNFFFVLSGFLITYLLIVEKKLNDRISLKKFWVRRILRIWPLYFSCVLFGFFVFPILKIAFGEVPNESASFFSYLFFLSNFDLINNGLPDASILGILWSVAIEEQFYLVWPVLLLIVPFRHYGVLFISVIVGSIIFRAFNINYLYHEFHTLSCIGDMAIGGLGALAVGREKIKSSIVLMRRYQIYLIYLIFLSIYFFRKEIFVISEVAQVFERVVIAIAIILIILEQNYAKKSFFKMKEYPILSRLGKISYGLYCLHFLGILSVTKVTSLLGWNQWVSVVLFFEPIASLFVTIFIASVSYRFLEKPFLRLKKKFAF